MTEYICPDCLKNFSNSKSHFERHRNKKKPCGLKAPKFHQNSPICIEIKDKEIKPDEIKPNEINPDEKEHLCEYCYKIFSRKFCLERHLVNRCKQKNKFITSFSVKFGTFL